jgi:hypothetical protein
MIKNERLWDNAIHFTPDEFTEFWSKRFSTKRDILTIIGIGWDPRMTVLLNALKSLRGNGLRHLHCIGYTPSYDFNSPHQKFINKNNEELNKVTENWAKQESIPIITRTDDNRYIGDREIEKYYINLDLRPYTDILIDISSLSKSLYFTLLLILVKKAMINHRINIHVVVCQDVELDNQITEGADDTRYLKGFRGNTGKQSMEDIPKIWAPLLSENKSIRLQKLYERINPKDIYPILPFPSRNPRKDDDLLIEYRQIFVDEWQLNPMNIIYAAEDDPLDVYRRVLGLFDQQKELLELLGGVSMVISALSSKISSIGAFMAAYEEEMAVAHSIGRHEPPEDMSFDYWNNHYLSKFKDNLHSIWLTGDPYVS